MNCHRGVRRAPRASSAHATLRKLPEWAISPKPVKGIELRTSQSKPPKGKEGGRENKTGVRANIC